MKNKIPSNSNHLKQKQTYTKNNEGITGQTIQSEENSHRRRKEDTFSKNRLRNLNLNRRSSNNERRNLMAFNNTDFARRQTIDRRRNGKDRRQ